MRVILFIALSFIVTEIYATECNLAFTWDENPASENVTYYTIYNDTELIDTTTTSSYTTLCMAGSYRFTATNSAGESPKTLAILVTDKEIQDYIKANSLPSMPGTVNINIYLVFIP